MSTKHFLLTVMTLLIFTTLGLAYGSSYDITEHKDTNGYPSTFLELELVKTTCQEAFDWGVTLGYCSKELGTL